MLIDSKRKMKEIMRLINSMSGSVSVGRTKAKAQGSGLRCWGYVTYHGSITIWLLSEELLS